MRAHTFIYILLTAASTGTQCTSDVASLPCDPELTEHKLSYNENIFPILAASCAVPSCHVSNFPKGDFTQYDDLKAVADNGKLYFRIAGGQMPPASSGIAPLTVCELNLIYKWIDEGAQE